MQALKGELLRLLNSGCRDFGLRLWPEPGVGGAGLPVSTSAEDSGFGTGDEGVTAGWNCKQKNAKRLSCCHTGEFERDTAW